jgi:surface protein
MPNFIFTIDTDIVSELPVDGVGFTDFSSTNTENGGTYTVDISWSSFTRANDTDGLSFNSMSYKTNTSIDISEFGGIDLTNDGSQFANFAGTISATDSPTVPAYGRSMFSGNTAISLNISHWDMSSVTDMKQMFQGANTSFTQDLSWNTVNVTTMQQMFRLSDINSILYFDTKSVTNMINMFNDATSFNKSINWNTPVLTNMSYMFDGATSFNSNLTLNTTSVTDMSYMFNDTTSFNQDIGSWDTGSVDSMKYMFKNANAFNQDIGSWNTGSVTTMQQMFYNTTAFNQDISNWNTVNVINLGQMFQNASSFNYDLSWNVSNVTSMTNMFYGASSFNQNIGSWDFSTTTISNLFTNAGIDYLNWSAFVQDVSANNTMTADIGTVGFYRIDDTDTNNAYNWLIAKGVNIIDGGAYPIAELELMQNIVFPNLIMTEANSGITTELDEMQQYSLITDSGGVNGYYDDNEDTSHNYTFLNGVSLTVYTLIDGADDALNIYDTDENGTLLYSGNGTEKTIIDISNVTNIYVTFTSGASDTHGGYVILTEIVPTVLAKICFRKGTLVDTDQGSVEIDKIDKNYHTIRNLEIMQLTKTLLEEQLVTVESNALEHNVPCTNTVMSRLHGVFYKNEWLPIEDLVNGTTIYYINNDSEIVYNILLKKHSHMIVNNMIVETLHPDNMTSMICMAIESYTNRQKCDIIKKVNDVIKRKKIRLLIS